jgi:hypothetical protein
MSKIGQCFPILPKLHTLCKLDLFSTLDTKDVEGGGTERLFRRMCGAEGINIASLARKYWIKWPLKFII